MSSGRAAAAGRPSEVVEDYLLAIYRLGLGPDPVLGVRLAEELGVTPATVTEQVGRLRQQGLVSRGRRIELTGEGLRLARTLVTRHRLIERFLVDTLGLGWDEVHDEAHRLEHALSAHVTERLADFLGHPQTCPHGHPIMEDGQHEPALPLEPLSELGPSDRAVVRRIAKEEPTLLRLLTSMGVGIGTPVRVDHADPYGGPLHIDVGGSPRVIGVQAAREVLVERDRGQPAAAQPAKR